jgi:hypothetical protein
VNMAHFNCYLICVVEGGCSIRVILQTAPGEAALP